MLSKQKLKVAVQQKQQQLFNGPLSMTTQVSHNCDVVSLNFGPQQRCSSYPRSILDHTWTGIVCWMMAVVGIGGGARRLRGGARLMSTIRSLMWW